MIISLEPRFDLWIVNDWNNLHSKFFLDSTYGFLATLFDCSIHFHILQTFFEFFACKGTRTEDCLLVITFFLCFVLNLT